MTPTRIPLFPLDVVLFPSMPLPLHIFEPRYKKMTTLCLNSKLDFGVIYSSEKSPASIGCTAAILQLLKEYPDGRMDILTQGRALFRVASLLDEKEYHEAIVEYLPEDVTPQNPGEESQLLDLFNQCHNAIFGQAWNSSARDDSCSLAYQIAARLPLALDEKQGLLEMREESGRRNFLFNRMTQLLPSLLQRQRIRKSAGGNGHGAS
jgi:Lon protease-like protein